ncbi:antitoxin [Streptomyces alkaliterrae]|uniref:antitoxin n=1 Tax=Streptomyces alkaliterrae TaxID=2213162 RepID=UPI001E2C7A60|nr:antitoxin [Streptomyces alkaliterrae]
MAKTQLNVRVEESTADTARQQARRRGVSVNRYIEELVLRDAGEAGHSFVESAADFMKQYEAVFAEEFAQEFTGEVVGESGEDRPLETADSGSGERKGHTGR